MTITKGVAPAGTGTNGTGDVANVPAPSGSDQSAGDYPPSMDEVRGLREEAKRHRFAGRAAESERDQLRARVDAQDRREVERIAGGQMQNAGDLTALHIRSGAARCDASPELTVEVVWSAIDLRPASTPPVMDLCRKSMVRFSA